MKSKNPKDDVKVDKFYRLNGTDGQKSSKEAHTWITGGQTTVTPLIVWLVTVGEPLPIATGENPRLLRTGRLARCLTDQGHDVVWWTSAFDHFAKRFHIANDANFEWEGGQLRLLKSTGYKSNVSIRRFVEHAGVARKFALEARKLSKPDVILVSLPTIELAHAAVEFGRASGVPVMIDIRDLWPDVLIDVLPARWRWLSRLLLSNQVRRARTAMSRCDALIAVSHAYLQWGLGYAGRPQRPLDATIPLGYVAPEVRKPIEEVGRSLERLGVREDATICWYVGTFGRQYDLAPIIEAARILQSAGRHEVQFVISGEGELGSRWKSQAAGLTHVVFTGWIGADEINWLRGHTAIGLQPYIKGAPQGLANKLFEYISAGIPVVSSLAGENSVLIEENQCGLSYAAGDERDCLRQLLRLLDDADLRRGMGQNGKRLFEAQFNADSVFNRLIEQLKMTAAAYKAIANESLGSQAVELSR